MNLTDRLFSKVLNHVLAQSRWATERLQRHRGAVISIEGGLLPLLFQIDGGGYFAPYSGDAAAAVTITLPKDFLAKALVDREHLFSAVRLQGAVDLAETLAFVFRNLSVDFEGELAQYIGDIPAYRLNKLGIALRRGLGDGGHRLFANLAEFSVEETALVVDRSAVAHFNNAVDVLRDDLARLDKRIQAL